MTAGPLKDAIDTVPSERNLKSDEFANRKLIRPTLARNEHSHAVHNGSPQPERPDRPNRNDRNDRNDRPHAHDRGDRSNGGAGKKLSPPEQTNAENFYYQKQMQSKTPMVLVLRDGEQIHGIIEWYDKTCLKLNRTNGPNLLIYKPSIKYMFKEGENSRK